VGSGTSPVHGGAGGVVDAAGPSAGTTVGTAAVGAGAPAAGVLPAGAGAGVGFMPGTTPATTVPASRSTAVGSRAMLATIWTSQDHGRGRKRPTRVRSRRSRAIAPTALAGRFCGRSSPLRRCSCWARSVAACLTAVALLPSQVASRAPGVPNSRSVQPTAVPTAPPAVLTAVLTARTALGHQALPHVGGQAPHEAGEDPRCPQAPPGYGGCAEHQP